MASSTIELAIDRWNEPPERYPNRRAQPVIDERPSRMGHQCRGRHIVTDGGVDQHLPFPPALSIRRAIAELGHSDVLVWNEYLGRSLYTRALPALRNRRSQDSTMTDNLYCSFCAKSQNEVRRLIAGPRVFACDECVMLMAAMLHKENRGRYPIATFST